MNGRLLPFPSRQVIQAVRLLEREAAGLEAELAASVIVSAMKAGEAVPSWSLRVLISTMLGNLHLGLGQRLAEAFAEFDGRHHVLVVTTTCGTTAPPTVRMKETLRKRVP